MDNLEVISKNVPVQFQEAGLSKEVLMQFASHKLNAKREETIANESTPADFIKEREGGGGTTLEYHTEEYVIRQLNKHYPGWWMEDMHLDTSAVISLRIVTVEGYLCVAYPDVVGERVAKRWSAGSERIEFKKGTTDASQPEDRTAAARTRWLKLCAKLYGIGLDIYHQRVTEELVEQFEDRIIKWNEHSQKARDIASVIETGAGMRRHIRSLHPPEITKEFMEIIKDIPKDKKVGDTETLLHDKLWSNFVKIASGSEENIKVVKGYFTKIKILAEKLKNT
jgi:hypothetical protein